MSSTTEKRPRKPKEKEHVPIHLKLMLSIDEAAEFCSVSRDLMIDLTKIPTGIDKPPRIRTLMLGEATKRIPRKELEAFIDRELGFTL